MPEARGQCCENRHRWLGNMIFSQLLGEVQNREHLARIQWALELGKAIKVRIG